MKATGIVRRMDELGHVIIPREVRRNLQIKEGDRLEIFLTQEGGVVFQKCEIDPILSGLNTAQQCATNNRDELPERVRNAITEAAKIYADFKEENEYFPDSIL